MPELIIEAGHTEKQYWRDLWRYRELFYFLTWRDVLVRYKQTVVGIGWAIIRPFLTMVVFTLIFGRLAKLPSGSAPYPVLIFSALLPWQFFSGGLSEAGNSLLSNSNLISKIYFPRLLIPVSAVITTFMDFLIAGVFLAGLLAYYRFLPGPQIIFLPFFALLLFVLTIGAGIWFAALVVTYRDVRFVLPFILQFGLYISPVAYSSRVIPDRWRLLYSLNPLAGIIDGFRWAILDGTEQLYLPGVWLSCAGVVLLSLSGVAYFRKVERSFADLL